MKSLADFVSANPGFTVVYVIGMVVSIGFSVAARATHRRNVAERLARPVRHDGADSPAQCRSDALGLPVRSRRNPSQGDAVLIRFDRMYSLVQAKELLQRLAEGEVPFTMRSQAEAVLRHYPTSAELDALYRAAPDLLGPAPPSSPLSGTAAVAGGTQAARGGGP
jgi:hypothetical protein